MRRHVVIFAKEPRLGAAKTRLARDIGAAAALHFYETTLRQVLLRVAGNRSWSCHLAVAPRSFLGTVRRRWPWLPHAVALMDQGEGDLGARMAHAFQRLPPGPAVLVGSDIPGVAQSHIEHAFALLGCRDAVFGPAEDGGYWLVGQRRLRRLPALFRAVRWSTRHALADTLANLRPGESFGLVEHLSDVDDGQAHARLRRTQTQTSPLPRGVVTL
jgi:hypothetical protein